MPLLVLIGLGILGLVLLSSRRQGLLDLIETLYNFIRGSFWKIVSIVIILLILFFLLGISWVGIWSAIGKWAFSPKAGILIGVLSLAGIFISDENGWIKRICVALFAIIVFGFCFPTLKEAINRFTQSAQEQLTNELDTLALQGKPLGVKSGVVTKDATLRNDYGSLTYTTLRKGQEIRTITLEKRRFGKGPEAFVNIMTKDVHGEFVNGVCGWVAIDNIRFSNNTYEKSDQQYPEQQTTSGQNYRQTISSFFAPKKNPSKAENERVVSRLERAVSEPESEYSPFFSAILSSTPIELDLPSGKWMTSEHISVQASSGGFQKLTPNIFTLTGEKTKVWVSLTRNEKKNVIFYYKNF